ncbi:MAG: peptidoglycan DD-metalloendopeptidase family protein [bacterium]
MIFVNRTIFYLIAVFITAFSFYGCGEDEAKTPKKSQPNEYGLIVDSLTEYTETVKPNETLADLLLPYNVPYKIIHRIGTDSSFNFDVRKIRVGNNYSVYCKGDTLETAKYFVYESDQINYTVIDLSDSIKVYTGKKEVTIIGKAFAGVINNSLYGTIESQDVSPMLAMKLSEVFAWQIDFYTVQKGDYFKVIYEEEYVGDKFIRIGKVYAAVFNHIGKNYYGFYFEQGDERDFFDENGNSLRKAFLKAPLKFTRITSRFTNARFHPILRRYRPHLGIDYAAPRGTPVQAVGDGTVVEASYKGGNGNYVKIRHNSTYQSGYMHLSKYGPGIRVGAHVRQGQIIGFVGSTGLSTGPHLDFRFWNNNQLVNYLTVEFPPSHPINKEYRENYNTMLIGLKHRLEVLEFTNNQNIAAATDSKNKQ